MTPTSSRRSHSYGRIAGAAALMTVVVAAACAGGASGASWGPAAPVKAPAAAFDPPPAPGAVRETAVLSGGCFWGLQGVFEHVRGVRRVLAGYAGGPRDLAQYELVSTGTTGHAESVQVEFDPRQISYGEILRIYFSVATDPTQLNRQFPDEGPQYRGDVFYLDARQKTIAQRYVSQLSAAHVYARPIVTRIDRYVGFFPAEAYHQDYLQRHPDALYIATYDMPKVEALARLLPQDFRSNAIRSL